MVIQGEEVPSVNDKYVFLQLNDYNVHNQILVKTRKLGTTYNNEYGVSKTPLFYRFNTKSYERMHNNLFINDDKMLNTVYSSYIG